MSKRNTATPVGIEVSTPEPDRSAYELAHVLCLYKGQGREMELSMLHRVTNGKLGPGMPVNPIEFARTIHRLKKEELIDRLELVGPNVLAENRDAILWWRPAGLTPMWFKTATPEPRLTALNGVPLPQPPLVFRAMKRGHGGLCVWALAENVRPTASTPLYHAPYMNMAAAPHVCLGTLREGAIKPTESTPTEWERVFFDSNFSHTPPSIHAKDYLTFLEGLRAEQEQSIAKEGCNARPLWSRHLVSARTTLASTLQTQGQG